MLNGTLLLWLISIFSISSSTVLYITNEKYELIQFAHDIAVINHINPEKFIKLLNCESQFNPKAKGDYRIEEDRFMANGIAQFWRGTFDTFSDKYDFDGKYINPHDQIILAGMMIRDGLQDHWRNCWRSASK